jgi:hypothetical protein
MSTSAGVSTDETVLLHLLRSDRLKRAAATSLAFTQLTARGDALMMEKEC